MRIVATTISSFGRIDVRGGTTTPPRGGKVRMEAITNTWTGLVDGATPSFSQTPTQPTPATMPALRITSIGGISAPSNPVGSLTTPDITFPNPMTSPVSVDVQGVNIPVGTTVTIRIAPTANNLQASTATTGPLTGSLANSTASASLTLPSGVSSMTLSAAFEIAPIIASLSLPQLDGASPVRVEVVASAGGPSKTYLVGTRGSRMEMTPGMWESVAGTAATR